MIIIQVFEYLFNFCKGTHKKMFWIPDFVRNTGLVAPLNCKISNVHPSINWYLLTSMCIRSNCVDPFLIVGVSLHLVTSYCILVHHWVSGYICQHLAASDSILKYPGASFWILLNPTASVSIWLYLPASFSIRQHPAVSWGILLNPTESYCI